MSLTSLIDVIFLLLLFFMLTSTFSRFAEVELSAAVAGAGGTPDVPPLFLRLTQDAITLNGDGMTLDALPGPLAAQGGQSGTPPRTILVSMTAEVSSQRLTDLLGVLRSVPGVAPTILGSAR